MSLAQSSLIICLIAGLQAHPQPKPVIVEGFAAHYNYGLMERVAANRGMSVEFCMVATPRGPLGQWVRVQSLVTGVVLECRITDVAQPAHVARIEAKGIVLEFSADQIGEMCNLSYVGESPPRACPVLVEYR